MTGGSIAGIVAAALPEVCGVGVCAFAACMQQDSSPAIAIVQVSKKYFA
ncbi:MAG: hypothetical protein J0G35_16390 [Acidobacteriales bacterium]|jgi:hypothetical protein|nr:hypothetical protein [Terriglobales bacterium]